MSRRTGVPVSHQARALQAAADVPIFISSGINHHPTTNLPACTDAQSWLALLDERWSSEIPEADKIAVTQQKTAGENGLHGIRTETSYRMKLNSLQNLITFLQNCIAEQVLPRSAPQHLRFGIKPFIKAAHQHLLDSIETLKLQSLETQENLQYTTLPTETNDELRNEDQQQKANLATKLCELCSKSKWNDVRRPDLIHNISSYTFTQPQQQALSLGLKFDTGTNTKQLSQYLEKNYKWRTNDIDIGFIQGILLCCTIAAKDRHPAIPRRFIMALNELQRNENILITTADKGGGIVIMDKADIKKIEGLLTDTSTYTPQSEQQAKEESRRFNTDIRKILKRTNKGKQLLHLLEEDPKTPTIRGIPKTHKAGIPMRPITNEIGSAPHKLAKILAKPLTLALGTISDTHIRNSTDLIQTSSPYTPTYR
ncbi:uncharacterized protein LOC143037352 [Oratosquilla oratoria]|uniref:uncharacterized protein LOC143037352 n=1 Tax=Oratosquilla oratoria TaxID=337810 RepID=UPI003F76D7B2